MAEIRQIQVDGVNYDLVISEDEVSATAAAQSAAQALAYKNQAQSSAAQAQTQATNASNQADRAEDAASRAEAIVGGEFVSYGQAQGLTDAQREQARENINAASDSDVVKITAQTLTSAQQAQARANIMAGGSNWNFLDNSWFTVNQRSFTSTSSGAYFADRWQVSGNTYTLTRRTTGITIQVDNGVGYLFQKMESAIYDFLDGKTVTYSFRFSDDTVISRTFVWDKTKRNYPLEIPNDARFQFWYGDVGQPCLRIFASSTGYDIDAIKLELGSVSTLANDAPPNYAEELAKCMRYFIRIKGDPIGSGYVAAGLNQAYIHIPTPVPMRTAPTASINGSMYIRGTGATWNVSSVTVPSTSFQPTNGVSVIAAVSATQVMAVGAYMSSANSYIDLTADL